MSESKTTLGPRKSWETTGCDAALPDWVEKICMRILMNKGWRPTVGPKMRINSLIKPMDYSDAQQIPQ